MKGFILDEVRYVQLLPASIHDITRECVGVSSDLWEYSTRGKNIYAQTSSPIVKVAIGTIDATLTIDEILTLLDAPDQRGHYRGSGAWVRSAYLRAFPHYDGKGPILFPDNSSLWKDKLETRGNMEDKDLGLCATGAWHDNGRVGPFSFDWVKDKWRAGKRIAVIDPT